MSTNVKVVTEPITQPAANQKIADLEVPECKAKKKPANNSLTEVNPAVGFEQTLRRVSIVLGALVLACFAMAVIVWWRLLAG